jgi:riboflavin kinase/FMN adenylyltransferase
MDASAMDANAMDANTARVTHGVTALTFDPHPAALLSPERAPGKLTTIERRTELLLRAGADHVVVQRFDRELSELAPEAFLARLVGLGACGLVVGPDFRFGKDRAGDVDMLLRVGAREGLAVRVEPPVLLNGERVSSSAVRAALAVGQVDKAAAMLGRVHEVQGRVVQGQQGGRTIGFPTANIEPGTILQPSDGVYAVIARVVHAADTPASSQPRRVLTGVANLGVRPTLGAGRSVEVHLFDFDADLYGATLRVGFVRRVRDELKLSSLDALRAQIERDCQTSRDYLAAAAVEEQELWAWI